MIQSLRYFFSPEISISVTGARVFARCSARVYRSYFGIRHYWLAGCAITCCPVVLRAAWCKRVGGRRYADEAIEIMTKEINAVGAPHREYVVKMFGGGNMFPDRCNL
jgi:hypothetical protein